MANEIKANINLDLSEFKKSLSQAENLAEGFISNLENDFSKIEIDIGNKNAFDNLQKEAKVSASELKKAFQKGMAGSFDNLQKEANDAFNTQKKALAQLIKSGQASGTAFDNAVKELKKAQKEATELDNILKKIDDEILVKIDIDSENAKEETNGLFNSLKEGFSSDAFKGAFTGVVAGFGVEALIGGIQSGVSALIDFNEELARTQRNVATFTGLSGDELTAFTARLQGTAETFGVEFDDVLQATNASSKALGLSFDETATIIEKGFLAGGNITGELLEQLKEYPSVLNETGFSLEEIVAISANSALQGVFSDKGLDTVKELGLRLRELTPATTDALQGIGINTDTLIKELETGQKSQKDAILEISARLSELPAISTEVGTAIADVFGGAGEDAGKFAKGLADLNLDLDSLIESQGEFAKQQERLLNANQRFEESLAKAFTVGEGGFGGLIASIKLFAADILDTFAPVFQSVGGALGELIVSLGTAIGDIFKTLSPAITAILAILEPIIDIITNLVTLIVNRFKPTIQILALQIQALAIEFKFIFDVISIVVDAFVEIATAIQEAILEVLGFNDGIEDAGSFLEDVGRILKEDVIPFIQAFVKSIVDGAKNAIKAAKDIANGIKSFLGFGEETDEVGEKVEKVTEKLTDFEKRLLAINNAADLKTLISEFNNLNLSEIQNVKTLEEIKKKFQELGGEDTASFNKLNSRINELKSNLNALLKTTDSESFLNLFKQINLGSINSVKNLREVRLKAEELGLIGSEAYQKITDRINKLLEPQPKVTENIKETIKQFKQISESQIDPMLPLLTEDNTDETVNNLNRINETLQDLQSQYKTTDEKFRESNQLIQDSFLDLGTNIADNFELGEESAKMFSDSMQAVTNKIGESLFNLVTQSESAIDSLVAILEELGKQILLVAIDTLNKQLQIAIAEAYLTEVGSKGLAGLVTGSVLAGVLTGIVEAAKAAIGGANDGVIGLNENNKGRPRGKDSILMMLAPDESVINSKSTNKYRDLLTAINNDNGVSDWFVNNHGDLIKPELPTPVLNNIGSINRNSETSNIDYDKLADSIAKSMPTNIKLEAVHDFDIETGRIRGDTIETLIKRRNKKRLNGR